MPFDVFLFGVICSSRFACFDSLSSFSIAYYDHGIRKFAAREFARPVELQLGGDTAVYPEVFPGVDFRVVHLNTGVRQEFVLSQQSERYLAKSTAELAVQIEFSGETEADSLLPFPDERSYVRLDGTNDIWILSDSATQETDVLLKTTFSVNGKKDSFQFDLAAARLPGNAEILDARIRGAGLNQDVKDEVEGWLAKSESNLNLTGLKAVGTPQAQLVVEWVDNTSTVYYLKDHLGSVRATVDETGAVVSYDDYDPWGLQLDSRSMTTQSDLPNKFTGKERDDDFGLDWDYFGARYYDPRIGRWLTVDPLADGILNLSPYQYTQNNPVLRIDPDGMKDWSAFAWGLARTAGGAGTAILGLKVTVASGFAAVPTAGLSAPGVLGGQVLAAYGFSQFGYGIADMVNAWQTPDGIDAQSYKTIVETVTAKMGGSPQKQKTINLIVGILTSGGGIGSMAVDGQIVLALIESGNLGKDFIEMLTAYMEDQKAGQGDDTEKQDEDDEDDDEQDNDETDGQPGISIRAARRSGGR